MRRRFFAMRNEDDCFAMVMTVWAHEVYKSAHGQEKDRFFRHFYVAAMDEDILSSFLSAIDKDGFTP